jgi:hypothetical protein
MYVDCIQIAYIHKFCTRKKKVISDTPVLPAFIFFYKSGVF